MEHVQPYLDYFAAHPQWAIAIIFLIAFGEALLIIGLFVPSTVVLVGAGTLVGTGNLDFWPVFLATTIGAFAGDQISFWAGKLFGDRLRNMWPLSRYPALVAKGEAFVREHGGKSIAIGRFVPGVKAVVPGIVGMLGMNQFFFFTVNFFSSIVWAAAHVLPGVLLGQGLALAGELSGRLAVVLLVLLGIIAVAGWLVRLAAAGLMPHVDSVLLRCAAWARARNGRAWRRFGRAISPGNPRRFGVVLFVFLAFAALLGLVDLISGLVVRDAVSNLDVSAATILSEWRNAPADELMLPLAMLADRPVLWATALAIVVWLFVWRAWRAALVALGLLVSAEVLSVGLGHLVGRAPPVMGLSASDGTFPSGHVLMAGLVFGLLTVIAGHAMGRWSRAIVAALCGTVMISVGFARMYLGADWMSSVLGGIMLATILAAFYGMVIEAIPSRRIRPLGLIGCALLVFCAVGASHVGSNYEDAEASYARPDPTVRFAADQWFNKAWGTIPSRRVDLAGKPEEVFVAQWVGGLEPLQAALQASGWEAQKQWAWRDALSYLDPKAALQDLAPRPLLHQGLKAKLTLVRTIPGRDNYRQVLRLYKTRAEVDVGGAGQPVYVMSLLGETERPHLGLYDLPATLQPLPDDSSALLAQLADAPSLLRAAEATSPDRPRAVFQAKP